MDDKNKEEDKLLYREYDDPALFKRLGRGFDDREQWRITQRDRSRLKPMMPPLLNLGAPAIDNDLDKILQAKERNPTYSSREIYFNILNQSVPLYKFKDIYSVDDLSSRFSVDELERLKTTYREQRVPDYEFFEYMDELIQYAKEKRAYRARKARQAAASAQEEEERQQLSLLEPITKKCPGPKCSILGGKLKNIFRNKNKSNKSKSKRVNKRVKKNKRYSRKSSKKSLKK
jgi:hypothetical protein